MESSVVTLLIGIAIGFSIASKPDYIRSMSPSAYGYTILGLVLLISSMVADWIGVVCVLIAYGLCKLSGEDLWSDSIKSFFSFKWFKLKTKKKVEEPKRFHGGLDDHDEDTKGDPVERTLGELEDLDLYDEKAKDSSALDSAVKEPSVSVDENKS